MAKLILLLLLAGAFLWALWIVLSRHALPDPSNHTGWRRRFVLATWLFVATLGAYVGCSRPEPMCYDMPPSSPPTGSKPQSDVAATLRAVWLTLDPARGEEFRKQIETLVAQGRLREPDGRMLALAFAELAFHRERTRSDKIMTCYEPSRIGEALYTSRENALKQVELLREAARKGTIDAETVAKARVTLAREMEMLSLAKGLEADWQKGEKLADEYGKGLVRPTAPASAVADWIVGLEGGPKADGTKSEPER